MRRACLPRSVGRMAVTLVLVAAAAPYEARAQGCGGEAAAERVVAQSAADAQTLVLADGRQVRLAAIEVPNAFDATDEPGAVAAQAKAFLSGFVGRPVTVRAARGVDRYGRIRAFVFSDAVGLEASLQRDMVANGLARVASLHSGPACGAALFAREREARAAKRGLWADSRYAVLRAEDPAAIRKARGHLAVVEGRVLSVRESGGTIYVNFGRRWSQDFTVTIAKRKARSFAAGGLAPPTLAGREVRVRGWVEERGGPWIEVTSPEQFEFVERREEHTRP